jgi:hypothetical protein
MVEVHETSPRHRIRSGSGAVVGGFAGAAGMGERGDTEEEAIANAREALALWFEPADVPLPRGAKVLELALP